jgi:hypothetical protein
MIISFRQEQSIPRHQTELQPGDFGLGEFVPFRDEHLTQDFGVGDQHPFQVADGVITDEPVVGYRLAPLAGELAGRVEEEGLGVALDP